MVSCEIPRHFAPNELSTFNILSKYGKIEFWLLIEEHTNTRRKKLQTAPLRKIRDIYQKNALESYLFYKQQQKSYWRLQRSPPQVKDLIQFEDDLVRIVKELKFRKVKNNFQTKLREDMKQVQTSKKTLTPTDKTSNMYSWIRTTTKTFWEMPSQQVIKKQIRTLEQKSTKKVSNSQNKQIY